MESVLWSRLAKDGVDWKERSKSRVARKGRNVEDAEVNSCASDCTILTLNCERDAKAAPRASPVT